MSEFSQRWHDKGDELSDTSSFWVEVLQDVLGLQNPTSYIVFQKRVELKHVSFIDAFIPSTGVIIEQKSRDIDLSKSQVQADGAILTPFLQAKRYRDWLPDSQAGRYIVVCNFREMHIHDMETPKADPLILTLDELTPDLLAFLIVKDAEPPREIKISKDAGSKVKKLYDSILERYNDKKNPDTLHSLNVFCVRLVFLLYAEKSNIFAPSQFCSYLTTHAANPRTSLIELFRVLNTKPENRDPYLDDDLAAFPYVNGGLFEDTDIEIPKLDGEPMSIILDDMSVFTWQGINPTIFGAIFESIINPDTRDDGGMHYTSIQNIHRVINPLFLDDLSTQVNAMLSKSPSGARTRGLRKLQKTLAGLTFLDPACGSGNFLTESYLSLRRLENKIIAELAGPQIGFAFSREETSIQVHISQFYGIEVNDFAVAIAKTALWIADAQMWNETKNIVKLSEDFLPLKHDPHITRANAIRIDWREIIPPERLSYIMGNPPFRGARIMKPYQKEDIAELFKGWGKPGDFDYVCCWYRKAYEFMKGTHIRAALVSTNSINQGDSVSMFWKRLVDDGLTIDFAHAGFVWNSEAKEKAHVHCAVIGFSADGGTPAKTLYVSGKARAAKHINAYLLDAPDWWIFSRSLPLCDVPVMRIGCQLIDKGYYTFTQEEYEAFIKIEPEAAKYFHDLYGGYEFLYNAPRKCLYLGNCSPHQIKMMPECYKRVEAVRQWRLSSDRASTKKLAETPTKFGLESFPKGNYIAVPQTTSERRTYIPMGFLDDSVMCTQKLQLLPNATLYHFGVLESLTHMAWMRVVAGRLEMRYSYSNTLVYNCFVWPDVSDSQRERIETTAQGILSARAKYPDSSLAELYDETLMPVELRRAHRDNDDAVREAYGFPKSWSELETVGRLVELYEAACRS